MDFLGVPSFFCTGLSDQKFEETYHQIYQNNIQNYYSLMMNSLSKCSTLSESTDSQLCFNSNLTPTTITTTPTTTPTTITNNSFMTTLSTYNDNSSIERNLKNPLLMMDEQNEPINLCIRDQLELNSTQYTNNMKIMNNFNKTKDNNNNNYLTINDLINNNNINNNNNSFYLTDLTNKMNMNLFTNNNHKNQIKSIDMRIIPDSLNQYFIMNYNNVNYNIDCNNNNNFAATTTTTTNNNNNSSNIQGSSMYSTIRTPSPTIQQSSLIDQEFLTSTPVWRNKQLVDDVETAEMTQENINKQQQKQQNDEKMKWRKYSRQTNRLYYSRNKIITHTQRKMNRKPKIGSNNNNNNVYKNLTSGDDVVNDVDDDVKENGDICNANTRSICRRRRVGWRGTTICAACGLMFEGMNQLNMHYSMIHGRLLESECNFAQYSNSKTSKLLFQAQLDLLLSEKQLQSNNSLTSTNTTTTSTTTAINENNFIPTTSTATSTSILTCEENNHHSQSTHPINKSIDQSAQHQQHPANNPSNKSYPCPKCNYTAKWPTELQKHVMVHANSRPFICCVCATSYKWSWDLGRHFTNSHPNLPNPYKRQRIGKTQKC